MSEAIRFQANWPTINDWPTIVTEHPDDALYNLGFVLKYESIVWTFSEWHHLDTLMRLATSGDSKQNQQQAYSR